MALRDLERVILTNARAFFNNPKLRLKDIMEWSSANIEAQDDEIVAFLDDPGVFVAVRKEMDKRS